MAWESAGIDTNNRGGRGGSKPTGVMFALDKAGGNESKRTTLRCRLGEDVCKEMRWATGDVLDLLIDRETKLIRIERVPTSEAKARKRGWKLLSTNTKEDDGKICTAYFKGSIRDVVKESIFGAESTRYEPKEWKAIDGGVICEFPK